MKRNTNDNEKDYDGDNEPMDEGYEGGESETSRSTSSESEGGASQRTRSKSSRSSTSPTHKSGGVSTSRSKRPSGGRSGHRPAR